MRSDRFENMKNSTVFYLKTVDKFLIYKKKLKI